MKLLPTAEIRCRHKITTNTRPPKDTFAGGWLFSRRVSSFHKPSMYLTRNHQEKTVMARVMRECKMHSEYFSLKEHGSWEKAESAARKWVRDLLPTLPAKLSSKNRMTSRNKSGVVGVHRSRGLVPKKNGKVYECPRWVARWPGCRLKGGLSWSVIQFDEDGAFVLAVLARRAESVSRESLLGDFSSIVGKKEFEKIAALRHV